MCLGVPMRIVENALGSALCVTDDGESRRVNTMLVPEAAEGDLVLVHVDSAMRLLTPEEASAITNALRAVSNAAAGHAFDHLIADLVDREPELPAHLRVEDNQETTTSNTNREDLRHGHSGDRAANRAS